MVGKYDSRLTRGFKKSRELTQVTDVMDRDFIKITRIQRKTRDSS